jgi:hypothetical protein
MKLIQVCICVRGELKKTLQSNKPTTTIGSKKKTQITITMKIKIVYIIFFREFCRLSYVGGDLVFQQTPKNLVVARYYIASCRYNNVLQ